MKRGLDESLRHKFSLWIFLYRFLLPKQACSQIFSEIVWLERDRLEYGLDWRTKGNLLQDYLPDGSQIRCIEVWMSGSNKIFHCGFFSIIFYDRNKHAAKIWMKSYDWNMMNFFFVQKKNSLAAMGDIPLNAGFDRLGIHPWSEERHQLEKNTSKMLNSLFFWNRHHNYNGVVCI